MTEPAKAPPWGGSVIVWHCRVCNWRSYAHRDTCTACGEPRPAPEPEPPSRKPITE